MLSRQYRGRHQHGNLATIENRLEGRADSNLGFSVTNITTDQAINRFFRDHVIQNSLDSFQLVRCLLVRKSRFKLAEHPVRRRITEPFRKLTSGLDLQQVAAATLLGNASSEDRRNVVAVLTEVFGLLAGMEDDPLKGGGLF